MTYYILQSVSHCVDKCSIVRNRFVGAFLGKCLKIFQTGVTLPSVLFFIL